MQLVVTDNNKRPFPLVPNPTMFSINGFNYVIDTNRDPARDRRQRQRLAAGDRRHRRERPPGSALDVHAERPDLRVYRGRVAQPAHDHRHEELHDRAAGADVQARLEPGLHAVDGAAGGRATSPARSCRSALSPPAPTVLNVYAGTPESGGADFFTYKNVLYTLVKSGGMYVAVQKSYTVYVSKPAATQQQLAVFDLNGTTYIVTDGTTAGDASPAGINPGTMWAATSISSVETQFGLVYGFTAQPTNVTRSGTGLFQFQATDASGTVTLYDIMYTRGRQRQRGEGRRPGAPADVHADRSVHLHAVVPAHLRDGRLQRVHDVRRRNVDAELELRRRVQDAGDVDRSARRLADHAPQGDFSLEFWHSIPPFDAARLSPVHVFGEHACSPLVHFVDVDFEDDSNIYVAGQRHGVARRGDAAGVLVGLAARRAHLPAAVHDALPGRRLRGEEGRQLQLQSRFQHRDDLQRVRRQHRAGLALQGHRVRHHDAAAQHVISRRRERRQRDAAVDRRRRHGQPAVHRPGDHARSVLPARSSSRTRRRRRAATTAPIRMPRRSTRPTSAPSTNSGMSGNASGFPSGGGDVTISNIKPAGAGANTRSMQVLGNIANPPAKAYDVTISVREVRTDGTFGDWTSVPTDQTVTGDAGLAVNPTGGAHLLIGAAFADDGTAMPLGNTSGCRSATSGMSICSTARSTVRNPQGRWHHRRHRQRDAERSGEGRPRRRLGRASTTRMASSPIRTTRTRSRSRPTSRRALLAPLAGQEREGVSLYVNGFADDALPRHRHQRRRRRCARANPRTSTDVQRRSCTGWPRSASGAWSGSRTRSSTTCSAG